VYLVASLSLASMQGCGLSSEDADESRSETAEQGADAARDVLLVGNSVSGTVSFLDAHTFENLGSMDVIPDRDEVLKAINADLIRRVAYSVVKRGQVIHHFEPSGGDRFLDDLFVSPDGTRLYASRSNLGDVAAFDLTRPEHPILWRTRVEGFKADHATLSPDGTRLVVSATSANVANVIDAATGKIVGSFKTGTYPHQNDYSVDGKHIYNSSIGNVSGLIPYALNGLKGDRLLVKVDAESLKVLQTWKFDYGIRPSVFTSDETTMYSQLSYLNGVIKFDLKGGKEVARSDQPLSDFALSTYATYDEYPHDSAHHGLAMSGDGQKLCDCGTIDNTVSILSTDDLKLRKVIDVGMVPYWATTSPDGRYCFVSLSGDDAISVIDYEAEAEVKVVPVGNFPQRSRIGKVPESVIELLTPVGG
jgi:YVTN family beta-propeller protein